jgi:CheY-like chemotaxis protein
MEGVNPMQLLQASSSYGEVCRDRSSPLALVVDDKPVMREMLSWMLSFQGYQPVCAANGLEALGWIENALCLDLYPAVILLDLIMPIMNGTMFLDCLRTHWHAPVPIPPVILLTVDEGNHDDLACSSVLVKPFHINDLCERLKVVTG